MQLELYIPGSPTRTGFVRGGVEMGARKRFQFSKR